MKTGDDHEWSIQISNDFFTGRSKRELGGCLSVGPFEFHLTILIQRRPNEKQIILTRPEISSMTMMKQGYAWRRSGWCWSGWRTEKGKSSQRSRIEDWQVRMIPMIILTKIHLQSPPRRGSDEKVLLCSVLDRDNNGVLQDPNHRHLFYPFCSQRK